MLKRIFSVVVVFCMAMSIMSGFAEEININVLFQEARAASQNKEYEKANELF